MNRLFVVLGVVPLVVGVSSCVAVRTDSHFAEVRRLSEQRGQPAPVWSRTSDDARRAMQTALSLARDGLTRAAAARIAVLNNPALQAELNTLGVAVAEFTQAKLPRNPSVTVLAAFPVDVGMSAASLAGWLSDVWQLPRRKRVAEIAVRQIEYQTALRVIVTALKGADAWDGVLAARRLLDIDLRLHDLSRQTTLRLRIRYAHGLSDTGEVETAVANEAATLAAVQAARQEVVHAENRLSKILSLSAAADFIPKTSDFEAMPDAVSEDLPNLKTTLQSALDNRLDLAIAQAELQKIAERHGLEQSLVWRSVSLGLAWEGDFEDFSGGENATGPLVSVELPIFDQNQAGLAAAEFGLARAVRRLRAVQDAVTKDVMDLQHAIRHTRTSLELLEHTELGAAQTSLRYTEEWHHKMQLPFLDVLNGRMRVLETQRRIVATRRQLNSQWRMLELARCGGSPTMLEYTPW